MAAFLDLSNDVRDGLTELADKGESAPTTSKEPLQYRFHEVIYVYGPTLKALVEEKFGAGIMSAIDFGACGRSRAPGPCAIFRAHCMVVAGTVVRTALATLGNWRAHVQGYRRIRVQGRYIRGCIAMTSLTQFSQRCTWTR